MPKDPAAHDGGEEGENDIRRDDHLEREFGVNGRDYQRGSDSYAELTALRLEMARKAFANDNEDRQRRLGAEDVLKGREAELFDARMKMRVHQDGVLGRTVEDDRVALEDRDILRFRGNTFAEVAADALGGETAAVGSENQENVPDSPDPGATAGSAAKMAATAG